MSVDVNKSLVVPKWFVRNHPHTTSVMPPDEAGKYLLQVVEERTGLVLARSNILDIGCGTRFAASIINCNIQVGSYTGIDIYENMIDFLSTSTKEVKNMSFLFWNVKNDLYNPNGITMGHNTSLPTNRKYDIICFFSVFTHLNPRDANIMLRLTREVMDKNSRIFLTAFIGEKQEDDFIDVDPKRPLLKAVYSKIFFERIIRESGLVIKNYDPPATLMAHQFVLGLE